MPSRPIRVTYLITDLKVGGVPLHLYRLATRLPPDQAQPRVIALADEGPVGIRLRQAGVPVQVCGARGAGDLRALWRLWRLLRADPPDILHALLFHANVAARLIGPAAGVPIRRILCEIQTVERERRWHLYVDNLTCRLCRLEIGNSPSVVAHLRRQAHVPPARLRCEFGAVDVAAIAAAQPASPAELGIPSEETIILWTGRLDPVKGFEEMLAGFKRAGLPSTRLVLIGDGPYRPTIERLIRELGLVGSVILLGERSDVPSWLRLAHLFLFCSRTEGLPNSVLEAMAAGLPIIATDVPGCRDLIRHQETGWLVKPGSPESIAGGLACLLSDRTLARRLGENARRWVLAHADVAGLAQRWLEIYRRVAIAARQSDSERWKKS
ncbi:MAG: glycosyltransferase [Phycisphaerae bacterium]|jgi:glycosyltransferase involved in cell wall biosynthesis